MHDEQRRTEFTRHVRRARRREWLRTAGPFAIAALFVAAILGFMGWNTFSTVPCGEIGGVVAQVHQRGALSGAHGVLMVTGDDMRNYYSEDPGDRADPVGARVALTMSCGHTGGPRPMAHFDHWLDAGRG